MNGMAATLTAGLPWRRKQAGRELRRDVRAAAALVRRAVAVIEGREAETPALAAQWKAEGRAALKKCSETPTLPASSSSCCGFAVSS